MSEHQFDLSVFNRWRPASLPALHHEAAARGFDMSSGEEVGGLLRLLAASKPGGRFLEIGTGVGVGTAWLLAGMDSMASLVTVEPDAELLEVAKAELGSDPRVDFVCGDGLDLIPQLEAGEFDLVFPDAVPGKYELVPEALALLRPGGFYVVDDMLPADDWPEDHYDLAGRMFDRLAATPDVVSLGLSWASGVTLFVVR